MWVRRVRACISPVSDPPTIITLFRGGSDIVDEDCLKKVVCDAKTKTRVRSWWLI